MKKMSLALSIGVLGVLFLFSGCEESVSSENVTPSQAVLENGTECQVVKDSSSNYKVICSSDTLDALFNSQNKSEMASDFECSSTKISDEKTGKTGVQVLCKGLDTLVVWNGLDGKNGGKGDKGDAGESCNVEPLAKDAGYKIVCGGDSVGVVLNGKNGENGKDAPAGSVTDVAGCTATRYTDETTKKTGVSLKCGDASPVIIWDGEDGEDGVGNDGESCSTMQVTDDDGRKGVKITCPNSDDVVVWDGENGEDSESEKCTATRYTDETTKKTGVSLKCGEASPVIIWDGEKGDEGASCTTSSVTKNGKSGVKISCPNSDDVTVWNGENGEDGESEKCTATRYTDETTKKTGVSLKCGEASPVIIWDGEKGDEGASCTTTSVTKNGKSGVKISCPGVDPLTVWDGDKGDAGDKCTAMRYTDGTTKKTGVSLKCGDASPVIIWDGEDGEDGVGNDGESCSASTIVDGDRIGVKITCPNQDPVIVYDGKNASSDDEDNIQERCDIIRSTKTDFVALEQVLPCVKENEKLVIIIRHGQRMSNKAGDKDSLNIFGYAQAALLGSRMLHVREKYNLSGEFYYMFSKMVRAKQTVQFIAAGMGETFMGGGDSGTEGVNYKQIDDLYSTYFMNNVCSGWSCGTWQSYLSEYAYKYDAKYGSASLSAKDQVQKLIDDNFTYDKLKAKYTICGSHDTNVLPLMIVATETQIGMDYYNHPSDYYAPNYMSGVAYFMNKNGVAASIAVRGLGSGRLSTKK